MKLLLSIFFFFLLSQIAWAGNHFTYNVSGNFTVTQTNSGHTLGNNDTVSIIGTSLGSVTIAGISGTNIYIDFSQAVFAAHNKCSGCLDQMFWENLNGVTIADLNMPEHYMTITWHFVSNTKILRFKNVNTGSNISDAPVFYVDWKYNTDQVFTGSLSQTYYRDTLQDCKLDGFKDVGVPIQFGSNWSSGQTPTEIRRSIAVRPVFIRDTVQNVASSTGAIGCGAITGTGPGAVFYHCYSKNIDGAGSANHSHNESILWYGSVNADGNRQDSSYASIIRNYSLGWSDGIAGYNEDADHTVIKNSIILRSRSYSGFEISKASGVGNRLGNGFGWRRAVITHNTIHTTTGLSYNGPSRYNGRGVDFVDADSVLFSGNLIYNPEYDYAVVPYGPDSTAHNGYFYAEVGSAATNKTVQYNFSARYSTPTLTDSGTTFMPKSTAPFRGIVPSNADYTTDYNGVVVSGSIDAGAVQYVSAGSPPSCATYGTVTSIAQTTATINWTAGTGSPTSYDIIVGGVTVGNTISTSYNLTGLTANSTITYKVVPINASGSATGCSTSTFNTLPNPPACTTNLLPANATTVIGTTAATFTWNAASGATSYQFWLDGALVTSLGATTYNGFGYAPGSTHSWYVVPTNSGGSASGCSSSAFTFTTAVAPTVGILLIPRK